MKRRPAAAARFAACLSVVALAALGGCASKKAAVTRGPLFKSSTSVAYGTLAKREEADLKPASPLADLAFLGDTLYATTENNQVYALTPTLDLRFAQQIAAPGETVRRPLLVGKEAVFPLAKSLKFYDVGGNNTKTLELPQAMTSDVQLDPRGLLLAGTASSTGGFLSVIDPQNTRHPIKQDTLIGTVLSAPVALQGVVYVANNQGKVFAVSPENRSLWPLADMAFKMDRPVTADLAIDDYALYVPSTDQTLYAIDRTTGKIRWRYKASSALKSPPLLTKERVFQAVPDLGVVALNKTEGGPYHEAVWTLPGATQILGSDDKYLYAVVGERKIVAADLATGEVRLSVDGKFDLYTQGANGTVYAATKGGTVVSFVRQAYRGDDAGVAAAR